MSDSEFDKLYRKICKKSPAPSAMQAFRDHPERGAVIDFLVGKLGDYLAVTRSVSKWTSEFDWGATNACRLLGEFNATAAVTPMIEILDDVKDEYLAYIYSAAIIALKGMGQAGLEPAYRRYERDRANPEHAGVWLHVLTMLGVRDDRIPSALQEFMKADPAQAVMLMGDYGDPALLPTVEEFVLNVARELNAERIDPLAAGVRLLDRRANHYIEGRESLVLLREGVPHRDPSVREKIEALDRQLLWHSDFGAYDPARSSPESTFAQAMERKIGRNDPCPCGSGKKYKHCCERL